MISTVGNFPNLDNPGGSGGTRHRNVPAVGCVGQAYHYHEGFDPLLAAQRPGAGAACADPFPGACVVWGVFETAHFDEAGDVSKIVGSISPRRAEEASALEGEL